MALIPPFCLDCVVAIGFPQGEEITYGATGFLFGHLFKDGATPEEAIYNVYLITNRHVFQGQRIAFLRFNPSGNEPARVYDLSLQDTAGKPLWHAHADVEVDLAAVGINAQLLRKHNIQFSAFLSNKHVLLRKEALDAGLGEGDGVFILGFPLGQVGKERNYAVVRQGAIARVRDALVGGAKEFLVDASIFPGNSGGPVITRPEIMSITGTKSITRAWLIGVVAGYVPYQDIAISRQTNRPRIIFEENSGLAAVVPIDFVLETIATAERMGQAPPPTKPPPESPAV